MHWKSGGIQTFTFRGMELYRKREYEGRGCCFGSLLLGQISFLPDGTRWFGVKQSTLAGGGAGEHIGSVNWEEEDLILG